jgi:predicted RNA binding protein YcfA (HicA-like mRNA interferase family)
LWAQKVEVAVKMDKIKSLPVIKVIKALEKIGFQQIRQRGSHLFMRHPDGRTTIITVHPCEDIGKGMNGLPWFEHFDNNIISFAKV